MTTTTLAGARATRTRPPPCPSDYYSLLQMLRTFIKLLMMMFGSACKHTMNVTAIYFLLQEQMTAFQATDKKQVARLFWAIFVDARAYFNTAYDIIGTPPAVSSLDWLIGAMKGGFLLSTFGSLWHPSLE